jgi:pimeloyl-ACP methyl ester carboxylesterase
MNSRYVLSRRTLLAVGTALAAYPSIATTTQNSVVKRTGAALHVESVGSGEPVLLLHGGLGHSGWFDELRRHLVQQNRRVITMDSRGMGRSSMGDAKLSYATHEEDVHAVLDSLKIECADVIGFSDGGIVGYRMAARANSRVRRLVTIGSRWSAEHGRSMWGAFDSWNRKTLSEGPFKFIVDDYDRLNPDRDFDRLARAAATMWKDASSDGHPGNSIEKVSRPTLVVVGDNDPFCLSWMQLPQNLRLRERNCL